MEHKTKILVITAFLLAGNLVLGFQYFSLKNKISLLGAEIQQEKKNQNVVSFLSVFIDRVLRSSGEVPFEERLKMENLVRDLNDDEIFSRWQKFISSRTEKEAQKEVVNLLHLLVSKVYF